MSIPIHSIHDALYINNGNLGIGTAIPSSAIDVKGTLTVPSLRSETGIIDVLNTTLSNVQSLYVTNLTSENVTFTSPFLSNMTGVFTSNLYVDVITPDVTDAVRFGNSTLSNVANLFTSALTTPSITSLVQNIDVSGKTLSNIAVASVGTLTSDALAINVNAKTLSNVSSVFATSVQTPTITALVQNIDVSGKTLSNISVASVGTLTSDGLTINVNNKSLSNIQKVFTSVAEVSTITSTLTEIDVSGKTLSNINTVIASTVQTPSITTTGLNIDVNAKSLSNITTLSVANVTSDTLAINVSGKSLSNIQKVFTSVAEVSTITSTVPVIDVSTKSLSNITELNVASIVAPGSTLLFKGTTLSNINNYYATGDITIGGTVTASNLQVIGDFTTMNTTTSNTEQMFITNLGTGPALKVVQSGVGSQYSVAEFIDNESGTALFIGDTGLVGVGSTTVASKFGVYGSATIGTAYISTVAPTNGLIVSGNVGVGTSLAQNRLSIAGPVGIGATFANVSGPTDSLIVAGNVGIGITNPGYGLDVASVANFQTTLQQSMNTLRHHQVLSYGTVAATGNKFIGFTIAWANTKTLAADQIYAFKVVAKVHFTTDTNTTFTTVEGIVTPVDANPKPNGLLMGTPLTTALNTNNFRNITMTATRNAANAVDLKVNFQANLAPANVHMHLEVFAHSTLGDFTFTQISG